MIKSPSDHTHLMFVELRLPPTEPIVDELTRAASFALGLAFDGTTWRGFHRCSELRGR